MKRKVFFAIVFIASAAEAHPQSSIPATYQKDTLLFTLNAIAILLAMYIASTFLLSVIRLFLHDRLKKTLLEKHASEEVINLMLPRQNDQRTSALKWSCVLISTGIGLTGCYFTQPLGLHSVIIESFSVGLGFLAFFLVMKYKK